MNEELVKYLMSQKELGLVDFGSIKVVKPTGRFIETTEHINPDFYEPRQRWQIEVKTDFFTTKWVYANNLKTIQKAMQCKK